MVSRFYPRPKVVEKLIKVVLNDSATSAATSGVFLAAPRRTGKSTFMREELKRALEKQGALVIYADLWEDRAANPAAVIADAVKTELVKREGVVKRLAKSAGMESLNLGGFTFSLDRTNGNQISLASALEALSEETSQIIVLVIDEAQHAITTKEGEDTLFALKAARDRLNSGAHKGLRIVATGSNRNKLALLTLSKDQAFFGAQTLSFPPLDEGYVQWFCDNVNLDEALDSGLVWDLFKRAGFRPEVLNGAADVVRADLEPMSKPVAEQFQEAVEKEIGKLDNAILPVLNALTPLQMAVLQVMAQMGARYTPFEARTLEHYRTAMKEAGTLETKVEATSVQAALSALKEKQLVWQARRGAYDLEDMSVIRFLKKVGGLESSSTENEPGSSMDPT